MDQIALPYRIALGALLVLAALWFTVLKPGPVEAPAPPTTGLGSAVSGAKGAAAATASATQKAAAADPSAEAAASATGATSAAAPGKAQQQAAANAKSADSAGAAQETRDEAAPLLRDLTAGKVVVLAFLGKGSDDGAVRAALGELPAHGGHVVVRRASVERVGDFAGITNGVKVVGTPTVLVLGKGPKARTFTGLTTTAELDQAVGDMLARAAR